MSIIAITGHRPPEIGGFQLPNPTYNYICQEIEKILLKEKPIMAVSGMALGVDWYFINVCLKLKIPYLAAIPFEGQEKAWPKESQKTYNLLRKLAKAEIIVSAGGYSPEKMHIRNQFMVNKCDKLIAVYNGKQSGGTYQCLNYAKSKNKEIILIDPRLTPI